MITVDSVSFQIGLRYNYSFHFYPSKLSSRKLFASLFYPLLQKIDILTENLPFQFTLCFTHIIIPFPPLPLINPLCTLEHFFDHSPLKSLCKSK